MIQIEDVQLRLSDREEEIKERMCWRMIREVNCHLDFTELDGRQHGSTWTVDGGLCGWKPCNSGACHSSRKAFDRDVLLGVLLRASGSIRIV